jgi:hypothetical protein
MDRANHPHHPMRPRREKSGASSHVLKDALISRQQRHRVRLLTHNQTLGQRVIPPSTQDTTESASHHLRISGVFPSLRSLLSNGEIKITRLSRGGYQSHGHNAAKGHARPRNRSDSNRPSRTHPGDEHVFSRLHFAHPETMLPAETQLYVSAVDELRLHPRPSVTIVLPPPAAAKLARLCPTGKKNKVQKALER